MSTLFLAWQDPASRCWFPVGKLATHNGGYRFVYTKGAQRAAEKCQFSPLTLFPDLKAVYESDQLFPLFANRLPQRSRTDYAAFVEWLNLPKDEEDPIAVLVRSGGRRVTDNLEILPAPEPDESGSYHIHFFAHGLRHLADESIQRIEHLRVDERLLLVHDFQNPVDPWAIMLRTHDTFPGDRYFVGYCPRYLRDDFIQIVSECVVPPFVAVERLNPAPAPLQLRLLCSMTACWPADFRPFAGEDYEPLSARAAPPTKARPSKQARSH